jgi:hypothetical protein
MPIQLPTLEYQTASPDNQSVAAGETAVFYCNGTVFQISSASFIWCKGDPAGSYVELSNAGRISWTDSCFWGDQQWYLESTLTIASAVAEDAGTYFVKITAEA